jgi:aspartate-semialdehyde dehydrogenase
MKTVGMVGWRGMVGSVLMQRMTEERDFELIEPVFFSTSNVGGEGPSVGGRATGRLGDANDIDALKKLDVIMTCQGGDWTKAVYPKLRAAGWNGYWIDAASTLRMEDHAVIILDPVNLDAIKQALTDGVRDYIGGNCTVSLMLMGMHGLFRENLVEWATAMTYQAASGAGAANMRELVAQMGAIADQSRDVLETKSAPILDLDAQVIRTMRGSAFPQAEFGYPLAGSLLPWIYTDLGNGQSKEGAGRGQQDSRPHRDRHRSDRRPVCPGRRHALSQPGADDQAAEGCSAHGCRGNPGRRERLGPGRPERQGSDPCGADAIEGHRDPVGAHRQAPQALYGTGVPVRVHRRRSAAVGGRGTAAPDAANLAAMTAASNAKTFA